MGFGSGDEVGFFEPRDIQKGDHARAIAYFYTRYTQAGDIKKLAPILENLADWDEQHPPTTLQHQQYLRVKEVQGNINPY